MENSRFKFRAWDKVNKEMYEVGYIDFPSKKAQLAIIHDGICYKAFEVDLKDIKLLQYTGLKDKEDKEIYEGDILDLSLEDDSVLRCEIVYQAPSFCRKWHHANTIRLRQREIEPMAWNTYILYEVIGNIYENPELVQGSDK